MLTHTQLSPTNSTAHPNSCSDFPEHGYGQGRHLNPIQTCERGVCKVTVIDERIKRSKPQIRVILHSERIGRGAWPSKRQWLLFQRNAKAPKWGPKMDRCVTVELKLVRERSHHKVDGWTVLQFIQWSPIVFVAATPDPQPLLWSYLILSDNLSDS